MTSRTGSILAGLLIISTGASCSRVPMSISRDKVSIVLTEDSPGSYCVELHPAGLWFGGPGTSTVKEIVGATLCVSDDDFHELWLVVEQPDAMTARDLITVLEQFRAEFNQHLPPRSRVHISWPNASSIIDAAERMTVARRAFIASVATTPSWVGTLAKPQPPSGRRKARRRRIRHMMCREGEQRSRPGIRNGQSFAIVAAGCRTGCPRGDRRELSEWQGSDLPVRLSRRFATRRRRQ